MLTSTVVQIDDQPKCADPKHLPLVDAAFDRPGSDAGALMREMLCSQCPIALRCLQWAMEHHEYGVWGGTGPNTRTRHGAPPSDTTGWHRRRAAVA